MKMQQGERSCDPVKIEELVNQAYDQLTANDHQILQYIRKNGDSCKELSCESLASACHVSRTTLLRFCHRLNLKSFAELHYILKTSGESEKAVCNLDIRDACQSYHQMVDEVKGFSYQKICSLIYQAETIYIYGTGNAQKSEAEELKRIFLSVGKCVIDLFDLGEVEFAAIDFTKKDLFIIISLSGETAAGITILQRIESTGISTLSITRWDNNSIARLCTHNLYVGTRTLHGFKNLSYEMTAAFYVLLDIVFVNYLEYIRGKWEDET